MRKLLILGGAIAALGAPSLAAAQDVPPGCYRQDNRPAGTIIGGVAGALAGSAIAGRGDRTAGAVIGGIGGAIVGNQVAGSSTRCPAGYYYDDARAVPPPAAAYDGRFDRGAYWRDAPAGLRERTEWLERRIDRGIARGDIDRREARRVTRELDRVQAEEDRMRRRNGGRLAPADRDYLQARLDDVAQQIRWARQTSDFGAGYGR